MITDYFKGKTFVIFDLETTDLKTEIAEIIELAALKVVGTACPRKHSKRL